MTLAGGREIASSIAYGLGSDWVPVPTVSEVFDFRDDETSKILSTMQTTPAAAPIGNTNVLLGLQTATGTTTIRGVGLVDAPEGGTCHP